MNKKVKTIIAFMIIVTVLDVLISVISLKMFPLISLIMNCILIMLLVKYSKQNKEVKNTEDENLISDHSYNKFGTKEIVIFLFFPFVIIAVVVTYVMYLFI